LATAILRPAADGSTRRPRPGEPPPARSPLSRLAVEGSPVRSPSGLFREETVRADRRVRTARDGRSTCLAAPGTPRSRKVFVVRPRRPVPVGGFLKFAVSLPPPHLGTGVVQFGDL